MKKLHEKKILAVVSIIVFFVMLWSWIVPVECELTIRATIGDCNSKTISAEDLSPVAFRVKGAAELLRSQCFIDELARKSNVSKNTISCWIYRGYHPDIELLIRVADVLEMSLDELTGRKCKEK